MSDLADLERWAWTAAHPWITDLPQSDQGEFIVWARGHSGAGTVGSPEWEQGLVEWMRTAQLWRENPQGMAMLAEITAEALAFGQAVDRARAVLAQGSGQEATDEWADGPDCE